MFMGNNDGARPTTKPQAIGKADRLVCVLSGGIYAGYASLLTTDPQATDKAERCTVFAQKLCEHAGKLGTSYKADRRADSAVLLCDNAF